MWVLSIIQNRSQLAGKLHFLAIPSKQVTQRFIFLVGELRYFNLVSRNYDLLDVSLGAKIG
jgi:hypothetical protein